MCDVISAFPAVQSDSRSVIVALNIAHQSMNAVLVHLLHLCIVLPFSLQLLLDVLSHVCYSIFNWFLYRFNRLQKKKRSLSASSVSATPSRTSFRQVGQTPPWKISALCLILKKDLAIYFQMLHWCLSSSKLSVLKRLLKMAAGYAGIMLQLQSQHSSLCMQSQCIYLLFFLV